MARAKDLGLTYPISDVPPLPTAKRNRLPGGRIVSAHPGGGMWLYRKVPMETMSAAKSEQDAFAAGQALFNAYNEVAGLSRAVGGNRGLSKSTYRETHLLWVNVPRFFDPQDHPNAAYLAAGFPDEVVNSRLLLFGVRLRDSLGVKQGFRASVKSVIEQVQNRTIPVEAFTADYEIVDAALRRAGLVELSAAEHRLSDAWWNHGRAPDTPVIPHMDHVHLFTDVEDLRLADDVGRSNCDEWEPAGVASTALTFASVGDFELEFADPVSYQAQWGIGLARQNAVAVSVRGYVEPAAVTRRVLRSNRRRYEADINERFQAGKMNKYEQEEHLAHLQAVEELYATGGTPTLVDSSTVVAFSGRVHDIELLSRSVPGVELQTLANRQVNAWAETWVSSTARGNPVLHELPIQTIAHAGFQSLSMVGDDPLDLSGTALVGFTEDDRQPAWVGASTASQKDSLPLMLVAGSTGSGKLEPLSALIPTPTGYTRMGDLKVGDLVFGRDGKPYPVAHVHPIIKKPELYRLSFSDGQSIDAGAEHQWLVSSHTGRNVPRGDKRAAAIENWEAQQKIIARLHALADAAEDRGVTLHEIVDFVSEHLPEAAWEAKGGIRAALDMVDTPWVTDIRHLPRSYAMEEVRKTDPVKLYPLDETLQAFHAMWATTRGMNAARWSDSMRNRADAAERLLAEGLDENSPDRWGPDAAETMPEIARMLVDAGARFPDPSGAVVAIPLRQMAKRAGIVPTDGFREVVVPLPSEVHSTARPVRVYRLPIALKGLAIRLSERYSERPTTDAVETVMSTGEMLAAGLRTMGSQANFAVRRTLPLDLPDADLPIDPYLLGMWLGDGSKTGGQLTSDYKSLDRFGKSDSDYMVEHFTEGGFQAGTSEARPITVGVRGLVPLLRQAGLFGNKHIPMSYLRSSFDQRLALLQGLMDTDGSVSEGGSCELTLSDEQLAEDALDLIRSLGIKASRTVAEAGYRKPDGEYVRCKDRHRIHFTTALQVFRLPRKAERLPSQERITSQWIYVTGIEKIPDEPARCITVGSPDHTYLTGRGYMPTHNTMAMLWLASQWARQNVPVVICDPKTGSDHGPVVRAVGGQVHSLDELMEADGVFDPIRFAARPVDGVPTATSMLVGVNPWGSNRQDMERPLQVALAYGVQQGALCIGQALEFALRDGRASADMVDPVFEYADTEPMFRAMVGRNPSAEGLRLTSRLTYIKVGNVHLQLPQPGVDPMGFDVPLVEKVSAALVRMMVLGSAMAMTGRGGVVMLDEAWVFLSAGFAEVERLGRLARSQKVLPMLFTQRVTDAVNAGLTGFISRGLILPLEEAEARSACTLFNLEPTPERIGRIAAKDSTSGVPNPLSMKALWEGVGPKRRLIRGAVAIYADLEDRAVPVELRYPKDFLKAASTNPEDIARRDAALTFGSEPVMESITEPDAGFGGLVPIPSAQEQSNNPEESFF